ncbi:MAG: carbohydrate kinase family protein [Pseudoclavibacter sp.]
MSPLSSPQAIPTATAPVAVIGDAYIDEVFEGDKRKGTSAKHLGGAGLAVATDLALLGVDCALIASIGDDDGGRRIRDHLGEHGVRLLPTVGNHPTGHVRSVHVGGHTQSRFDEATRLRRIDFDDDQVAAIGAAPLVAVAGFAFDDKKQQRKLLAAVRQPQNRLVLDPNPREGLFHDQDKFRKHFERHASSALLVHLGSGDAELIFRSPVDEVTTDLLDLGASHVLATEGRNGSRWVNRAGLDVSAPIAFFDGPVVDTLGAGDAVLAVAIAALLREGVPQRDLEARAILHRAMALAGATIRNRGPHLHDADEVPVSARRATNAFRVLEQPPQRLVR